MKDINYKLGLIGNPLEHSKSPEIHSAAIEFLQLDAQYEKYQLEVDEISFETQLREMFATNNGLNVTIPFKEKVLRYLNRIDPLAKKINAVNTIRINSGGLLEGFNTDYYGFMESLKEHKLAGKKAAVIGCGGAAKAVIVALDNMEMDSIEVLVRNIEKARDNVPGISSNVLNIDVFSKDYELKDIDLLINTTPLGQGRLSKQMPVSEEQLKQLNKGAIVYDLIYGETMLLSKAKELNYQTFDGSQMLILQAVKSLSIWTGCEITEGLIKVMTKAYEKAVYEANENNTNPKKIAIT